MTSPVRIAEPRNGVLLLAGYGIRVAVERGHLCVEDGVGADRRHARFPRATRDLRRLVVLGHSGTVSFDALRWLSDIGAGFVQIDSDGEVLAAAGPVGLQDSRLRRAQAQAMENGQGFAIARELIREKLIGQRAVLDRLPDSSEAQSIVDRMMDRIDSIATIESLRATEAEAATAYWRCWAPQSIQFARRDSKRSPEHWRAFGRRASLVTGNPRKATNPANAILNYLYAIVESESRIAALAVGCDPGLGVMHVDRPYRDSLACDLMEPVRPVVDAWVLDLLESRTFRRSDFFENREGVCRIMPPLTKGLAETAPRWAAAVAPVAEDVAGALLGQRRKSPGRSSRAAAPLLTQKSRGAGRGRVRVRRFKEAQPERAALPKTCVLCGAELKESRRRYCTSCKPAQSLEAMSKAHETLQARRVAGNDPAHGGEAGRQRGQRNAETLRANLAWEREQLQVPDAAVFATEIKPKLDQMSLAAMMRATGLSRPYCSMIRCGVRVPHPRHWEALRALGI